MSWTFWCWMTTQMHTHWHATPLHSLCQGYRQTARSCTSHRLFLFPQQCFTRQALLYIFILQLSTDYKWIIFIIMHINVAFSPCWVGNDWGAELDKGHSGCSPSLELSSVSFPISHQFLCDCSLLHHVSPSPTSALKLRSMANLSHLNYHPLYPLSTHTLSQSIITFFFPFHFSAVLLISPCLSGLSGCIYITAE